MLSYLIRSKHVLHVMSYCLICRHIISCYVLLGPLHARSFATMSSSSTPWQRVSFLVPSQLFICSFLTSMIRVHLKADATPVQWIGGKDISKLWCCSSDQWHGLQDGQSDVAISSFPVLILPRRKWADCKFYNTISEETWMHYKSQIRKLGLLSHADVASTRGLPRRPREEEISLRRQSLQLL